MASNLNNKPFAVFSLPDTHTVLSHPDIGRIILSAQNNGGGQISVSYNMDLSGHTQTASGYTVINKTVGHAGVVNVEVAQNSNNDKFLQTFIDKLERLHASKFADGTLTLNDTASGYSISCSGVTPQKRPDRSYAQQSGTLQYSFLCANIKQDGGLLSSADLNKLKGETTGSSANI